MIYRLNSQLEGHFSTTDPHPLTGNLPLLDRSSDESGSSNYLNDSEQAIAEIIEDQIKKTRSQIQNPHIAQAVPLYSGSSESLLSYTLRLSEFKMAGDSWASIQRTLCKDKEVLPEGNVVPETVEKLKELLLKLGNDPIEFITCERGTVFLQSLWSYY